MVDTATRIFAGISYICGIIAIVGLIYVAIDFSVGKDSCYSIWASKSWNPFRRWNLEEREDGTYIIHRFSKVERKINTSKYRTRSDAIMFAKIDTRDNWQ